MPDGGPTLRMDLLAEALAGLQAPRKTLPPKLFYDAEGCRLFELITRLPEYYLTRTEIALLHRIGPEIGAMVPEGVAVLEYGAGSETKAAILLAALRKPAAYVPIDVAEAELVEGAARLARRFPDLAVAPLAADFLQSFRLPDVIGGLPVLGFFPGSTIGNLDPPTALRFLRDARQTLGEGAMFLLGADRPKEPALLLPAYDDAQGITAAFNRNILTRLNREAGATFDVDAFDHRALWNDRESRIEMHLVSRRDQTVALGGRSIGFRAGETIHTENSYKHTPAGLLAIARDAGWEGIAWWTDPDELFSIHMLRSGAPR